MAGEFVNRSCVMQKRMKETSGCTSHPKAAKKFPAQCYRVCFALDGGGDEKEDTTETYSIFLILALFSNIQIDWWKKRRSLSGNRSYSKLIRSSEFGGLCYCVFKSPGGLMCVSRKKDISPKMLLIGIKQCIRRLCTIYNTSKQSQMHNR